MPHLTNDDITHKVHQSVTPQGRYVLSRIIGRHDLSNQLVFKDVPPRREYEFIKETDPVKREEEIRRQHSFRLWTESEDCWCCQRWNYILPIITRNEIEECCAGEE